MKAIISRRLTPHLGGFTLETDTETQAVCGRFFHSKEQARSLYPPATELIELEEPSIHQLITESRWPEQSEHAIVTVEAEHAMSARDMIERQAKALSGRRMLPGISGWAVCALRFPYKMSTKGLIGYFDGESQSHLCFFHSKEEARRLVRIQRSLGPESMAGTLREVDESTLPESSTTLTQELTGPLATMFLLSELLVSRLITPI